MRGCFCWDAMLNEKLLAGILRFHFVGLTLKTYSYTNSENMHEEGEYLLTLSSRRDIQSWCREAEYKVWGQGLPRLKWFCSISVNFS